MSNTTRVFITGLSALTSTGATADDTWSALVAGSHGLDVIKAHDLQGWTHQLGGELKEFKPAAMLPDKKMLKVISPQDVLGINAAVQAVLQSQLLAYRDSLEDPELFNERTGVYVGSPGNKYCQTYDFLPLLAKSNGDLKRFAANLFSEVHPMWLLRILPNNVLAYTGITYGFKGANHNVVNHAVGGMQSIIEAYHAIKSGQVERAVVVAYDLGTDPQNMFYYEKLGVLSARHLKPFDADHDGTILADGAAALILESEASAIARQARCYGEIAGGMSATEAQSLFAIEAEGQQLASLMKQTLEQNALSSADVDLLVAHGNGNRKSDISEALAIAAVFGEQSPPVTGFKWSTGHTLCAAGVVDTVLATYALRNKLIPGIRSFEKPAEGCERLNLDCMPRSLSSKKSTALVVNRGFASMNACLVIKSCE